MQASSVLISATYILYDIASPRSLQIFNVTSTSKQEFVEIYVN